MEPLHTQGIALPRLGLGTFKLQGDGCRAAVEGAIGLGYRHIDTAEMYGNEAEVGDAIQAAGLPRADLHVTTKVWHENLAPDAIRRAFDTSLAKLKLDHVDLYLVHWPSKTMQLGAVMETLMKLRQDGRTRAIGVANFTVPLLKQAVEEIGAPIACNQVEYHVLLEQSHLLTYLRAKSIPLVAYCPLAQGKITDNEVLQKIGAKHDASAAQVALKWLLDQDHVAAIPKASRVESQQANLDALKLKLDDEDRAAIAALPKNQRLVNPAAFAPDWDCSSPRPRRRAAALVGEGAFAKRRRERGWRGISRRQRSSRPPLPSRNPLRGSSIHPRPPSEASLRRWERGRRSQLTYANAVSSSCCFSPSASSPAGRASRPARR